MHFEGVSALMDMGSMIVGVFDFFFYLYVLEKIEISMLKKFAFNIF